MLLQQVTQLLEHSQRYHVVSVGPHRRGDPGAEHRALVRAVVAGETEVAVSVLTDHLRGTRDAIRVSPDPIVDIHG